MISVLGTPRSGSRRRIALATAGLLAASGLSLTATGADAALSRVGPTDPATNFPSFYTDSTGLSLQPCLDGPPLCMSTAAELFGPTVGADGEGFYYSALTSVGGFDMAFVLEMAFLDSVTAPIVFQRLQFASRDNLLQPGATYTITHPYGVSTCVADETGNVVNNACRTEAGGAGGNDFTGALGGPIGPFVTWDTFGDAVGGPPAGYIGDGDSTPHAIEGGIRNFAQVVGPGVSAQTTLFNVYGKLAPGPMGSTSQRSIDFGSLTAPSSSHITYRSVGTQPISVGSVTASGPFTVTGNTCNGVTLTTGAQCDLDVTFTPTPGVVSSGAVSIADQTGTKTINLSGKGRLGVAAVSTSSVVMHDTKIGKKRNGIVTLSNAGDLDLTVSKPRFGGQNRHDFRRGLTQGGCVPGTTLAPGAACNVRVIFAPRARGVRKARLGVATSVGTQVVSLAGTGKGKDRIAPKVVGKSPSSKAKRVKRGKDVQVRFSEEVRGVTKSSLRLTLGSGKVVKAKLTKLEGGDLWRLDPKTKLKGDKDYRVRLIGARIHDRGGNRLASTDWKFHTRG